ncbi:MAG: hypothetical protein Q9M50_13290 [Methylococcales bacterium]|nr:hypothetical protein [Methylococcales bacterium]
MKITFNLIFLLVLGFLTSFPIYATTAATNIEAITQATTYAKNALKNAESAKAEFNRALVLINQLKNNCKVSSNNNCEGLNTELKMLNDTLVKTNKGFNDVRNEVVKAIGTVELVANRANLMLTTYESVSNPDSMSSYIAGLHTLATTTVEIGKEINLIDDDYILPAYSRTSAELGFLNSDSSYIPQGNVAVYPWKRIGLQADISGGKIDGDTTFNYGGHLFWRDPKSHLIGATIASINRADENDVRYGLETELYNLHPDWTLRLEGGYQVGNAISSVYGSMLTTWYPRFNLDAKNYGELADVLALKGGVYAYKNYVVGTLGLELQMRDVVTYFKNYIHRQHNNPLAYALTEMLSMPFQIFPRNSTFFINGALGSNDLDYVMMGINIYLGETPQTARHQKVTAKALKYKHRYQFVESSLFVDSVPKR